MPPLVRLMQDSAAAQQEILDHFKEEMEAIAHRWGDDAKNKAERTLNAALIASREAMMATMQDGAKMAAESLRHEMESTTNRLVSSIRESRRVAIMNLVAASITVFAAGLVLWVLM
jgi:CBS-domain-containing membrane protein